MLHVASYREVDYQNANTVLSAKTQNTCSCLIVACSCQSTTKKPEAEAHVRVHTLLHVVACCCVLLGIVAQGFNPVKLLSQKNPQISFVPCLSWSPKLSAAMLPFALLFQHYWGHACALHLVSKVLWVVSFPRCTACPSIVRSCCICLHITANMDAITPNIVGPPMLGVVWSICK